MYGSAFGTTAFGSTTQRTVSPYYIENKESITLDEYSLSSITKIISEIVSVNDSTTRTPIKTILESISVNEFYRYIDKQGFNLGVWSKTSKERHADLWNKVYKSI